MVSDFRFSLFAKTYVTYVIGFATLFQLYPMIHYRLIIDPLLLVIPTIINH